MALESIITDRPQRWDAPFGPAMTAKDVERLMRIAPFSEMDESAFLPNVPLRGILQNDCCISNYSDGDIILREGDYGNSAFLILQGEVAVALKSIPQRLLGRPESRQKNWFQIVRQLWGNSQVPEARNYKANNDSLHSRVTKDGQTRVFLQDIPRILGDNDWETMGQGELFGEMAALTRSPRSATVFSRGESTLLEIRWQGLRDLMKRSEAIREYTSSQYREHSLNVHLRETALFKGLDERAIAEIEKEIQFESYGDFDWQNKFRNIAKKDVAQQIDSEPLIVSEGDYVGGLILIRNGFARVSKRYGDGHRTLTYLGKGDCFGLHEILSNLDSTTQRPWSASLRAVGYVDALLIPTPTVEQFVVPNLSDPMKMELRQAASYFQLEESTSIPDADRMETLVQRRLINGQQAMLINLDRCTRCDDCVRACSDAHDGNPRFLRQGPVVGNHMVAHACMHCLDPVCMIGCPTGAIARDHGTGVVSINDRTCIGCGTCSQSCPYENIRMVEVFDRQQRQLVDDKSLPILKATKCDLCVEQNGGPACQHACPHDALVRLNMREIDVLSQWLER